MKKEKYFTSILYNRTTILLITTVIAFVCAPMTLNMIKIKRHEQLYDTHLTEEMNEVFPNSSYTNYWTVLLESPGNDICECEDFLD